MRILFVLFLAETKQSTLWHKDSCSIDIGPGNPSMLFHNPHKLGSHDKFENMGQVGKYDLELWNFIFRKFGEMCFTCVHVFENKKFKKFNWTSIFYWFWDCVQICGYKRYRSAMHLFTPKNIYQIASLIQFEGF